jgi:ribose transport system ATP-binding protein
VEAQLIADSSETAPRHDALALAARGISKTFGATRVLEDFEVTIERGQVHALLGENGSGKSTVIKILSGYHQPDEGAEILIAGEPLEFGSSTSSYARGCRFVHQDLGLIDTSTVADNLAFVAGFPSKLGTVQRRALLRRATEDLARVDLDIDPRRPVATLSPAERTGVAVARALREDLAAPAALLVLDEPTATLPEAEVERLIAIVHRAARGGVGVLYVTHRLGEVFDIADRITVLRDGHRVAELPVGEVDRAGLITLLVGSELEEVRSASDELPSEHGEPLMRATDVVTETLAGVSVQLRPGDVVGVAGITGSGRDSLLSTLFSAHPRLSGSVTAAASGTREITSPARAMKAGIAYLPADRKTSGGFLDLTSTENISVADLAPLWRWPSISRKTERRDAGGWIQRLGVRPETAAALPLGALSGGNQQKVLFGKWLRRTPKVLLIDEPTQGVDIGAKADLHLEVLKAAAAGAAVLISSADNDELAALCHRVLVMRQGRIVASLSGSRLTVSEISRACLGVEEGGVA